MKRKTIDVLEHIQAYCVDVEDTIARFGKDIEIFRKDKDYRNSVCMSIQQIGELSKLLPDDFRDSTKGTIYWPAIKGMRNLFAHDYGHVIPNKVWETAISDIPVLRQFCDQTIAMYKALEQEALEPEPEEDQLEP